MFFAEQIDIVGLLYNPLCRFAFSYCNIVDTEYKVQYNRSISCIAHSAKYKDYIRNDGESTHTILLIQTANELRSSFAQAV